MNRRTAGFAAELEKLGGVAGMLGAPLRLMAKHPGKALGVGFIAVPTAMAAVSGYNSGADGPNGRQLAAGRDASGRIRASDAAYTNFHELFPHKPSRKAVRALSKNYRPDMFPAVISKLKGK